MLRKSSATNWKCYANQRNKAMPIFYFWGSRFNVKCADLLCHIEHLHRILQQVEILAISLALNFCGSAD